MRLLSSDDFLNNIVVPQLHVEIQVFKYSIHHFFKGDLKNLIAKGFLVICQRVMHNQRMVLQINMHCT